MEYLGFTETVRFQRNVAKLLDENELSELQLFLCDFPDHGKVIKGSGGIRKMRWGKTGSGKRGGTRVIYFAAITKYRILLLDIYSKSEKEDLSLGELKDLIKTLQVWLSEN